MCQQRALVFGLLAALVMGCATGERARPVAWLDRLRPFQGPTGPDVVQLDVALLECPLGDAYINDELWATADEQVLSPGRRGPLEDNGFRIGQVAGITPGPLQTLLTSERSCANPRRIQMRAGNASTVVLGPIVPRCQFALVRDGERAEVVLDQAQCVLSVAPSLTRDGKTRLQFTPQVHHGDTALAIRPAAEQGRWMIQGQRPTENYAELSWDVALAPNEYVVIGTHGDWPRTLGHQCFVRPGEARPVQRLLVIRTGRARPGLSAEPEADDPSRPMPLALQAATWSKARGSGR